MRLPSLRHDPTPTERVLAIIRENERQYPHFYDASPPGGDPFASGGRTAWRTPEFDQHGPLSFGQTPRDPGHPEGAPINVSASLARLYSIFSSMPHATVNEVRSRTMPRRRPSQSELNAARAQLYSVQRAIEQLQRIQPQTSAQSDAISAQITDMRRELEVKRAALDEIQARRPNPTVPSTR